jgi:hypothetical protein
VNLPRNAHLWLPGLLRARLHRQRASNDGPIDVLLCMADHFEPGHGDPGLNIERARVDTWVEQLPRLATRFVDSDGRSPRHTFFFPAEQYRREHLDRLASLCEAGLGEVEVHLHHDDDTSDNLRATLLEFKTRLAVDHGLLSYAADGTVMYGFIHGNWALDNARPDGRHCGVNDELTVLRETGCYGDFTQPAAPNVSQTRTVNSVYYAVDDPLAARSHDYGVASHVGLTPPPEGLLMIQGPIALDWGRRIGGFAPGLDVAAIDGSPGYGPAVRRFRMWVDAGIGVRDRPEWVFVKIHTHGAPERNASALLGPAMAGFHEAINREFNDGTRYRLHYVTAREMVNVVRAAEMGLNGNAGEYRDYMLPPPPAASVKRLVSTG